MRDIDNTIVKLLAILKKKIKYKKKIAYKKSYILQNKYIYYNFPLQQCNRHITCNVYNEHQELQPIEYIEPGCDIYSILWLKNIWLKDTKAGVNYVVIQLKVYKPIIYMNTCLIIEDPDIFTSIRQHTKTPSIPPEYTIYVKMKKMGVPIQAIQMKMKLAGHDPNILQSVIDSNSSTEQIIIKKNSTPIQSVACLSPMDLLQGIRHKQLKKVNKKKINKEKKKQLLQRLGVLSRQSGIPTLEEILQTRNRLKKIK